MSKPALPPADPIIRNSWNGSLTGSTAHTIAAYLRSRFEGPGRRFTVVTCDESTGFQPKVRTSQRLQTPIEVVLDATGERFSVSIRWTDSEHLFRLRSNVPLGRDVREGPDGSGRDLRAPYVVFRSNEAKQQEVRIDGLSEDGFRHLTVIVAEDSDDLVFDL